MFRQFLCDVSLVHLNQRNPAKKQKHSASAYLKTKDVVLQGGACCAWALEAAIERMDRCGIIMPQADASFVHEKFQQCLLHWQGMRSACLDAGVLRWSFRPKHHYLEHIGESIGRTCLNARHLSCFGDESYLGKIKHLACKCHSSSAILRVFQRLTLGLGQRFKESRMKGEVAKIGRPRPLIQRPCLL